MRYLALCSDYDGTLAHHGALDDHIIAAMERLRASGRKLIMVTGRELDELKTVCPRLDLFDSVVAENGALIYCPKTDEIRLLGEPPSARFVEMLRTRGVGPIAVGRVIVATWEPHENTVLETIRDLGLELQVIFNKGAVMILPAGINKAFGLRAALDELNLSIHNAVGVGDAENDHAFLSICECGVAVSNALPSVKEKADIVTAGDHGKGVAELIDEMLSDDLASRELQLARHHIVLGEDEAGLPAALSPYAPNALIVGDARATAEVALSLLEQLCARGYNFCVITPGNDYDGLGSAVALGSSERAPAIEECIQLLGKPNSNAVLELTALNADEKSRFCSELFAKLRELRAQSGRPHWTLVDQAQLFAPNAAPSSALASMESLGGLILTSDLPDMIAPSLLRGVNTVIATGQGLNQLAEVSTLKHLSPDANAQALPQGTVLVVSTDSASNPRRVRLEPQAVQRTTPV